jgi:hypothetical protein
MPVEDIQSSVDSVTSTLEELSTTQGLTDVRTESLVLALRSALATLSGSLGECRQAVPYSAMHPVLGADGQFKWCCNHDPEHCGV